VKSQVGYLNELRASNWGYRDRVEVQAPTSSSTGASGMIIGPDGKPLSEDERKFLEEHFGQLDMGEPESNDTNESFDESDAAQEYEDFLRQEQKSAVDKTEAQLAKLSVAKEEKETKAEEEKKEGEPPSKEAVKEEEKPKVEEEPKKEEQKS